MEKTFKETPRFYSFRVKFYYNTFHVRSDYFTEAVITRDFSEKRNVDYYLMSGEYPEWVSFPVVFHQYDGMKLRDLMAWADEPFIISDRTVNLLEDNHITGWKTFPVEIYDKKGNLIWQITTNGQIVFIQGLNLNILNPTKRKTENYHCLIQCYSIEGFFMSKDSYPSFFFFI